MPWWNFSWTCLWEAHNSKNGLSGIGWRSMRSSHQFSPIQVANNWVFGKMMQRMIPAFQANHKWGCFLTNGCYLAVYWAQPVCYYIFSIHDPKPRTTSSSKHFLLQAAPASCWPTAWSDPPPWTNRATQWMPAIVWIKSNQFLFYNRSHRNAAKSLLGENPAYLWTFPKINYQNWSLDLYKVEVQLGWLDG